MLPHIALLSLLLIGAELCQSASDVKLRVQRDTRNIPSNMFTSLKSNKNSAATPAPETNDQSFNEQSSAVARPVSESGSNEDYGPSYQPGFRTVNFDQPFNTGGTRTFTVTGPTTFRSSSFGPVGFGSSGFSGSRFGPSRTSQTIPLISSGNVFPDPFINNGGFSGSDFGPSNNFYRSESYRYSSDGNGPPQFEQNVFDSRLGHGITNRNF